MPRGLGKMENRVLRFLRLGNSPSMTTETMRWCLYEQAGDPDQSKKLPSAWYTSVARACRSLQDRRLVRITPRRLESFEECVHHFPGKTLNPAKRDLRNHFLPILLKWFESAEGIAPKYTMAQNEDFHLDDLSEETIESLEHQWSLLEERLRPIYGTATESTNCLLHLICKGHSLFKDKDLKVNKSFSRILDDVCQRRLLPEEIMDELRTFQINFFSSHTRDFLHLKSVIHSMVNISSITKFCLNQAALQYVHEHDREFVENMPGYRMRIKIRNADLGNSDFFEYSPELLQLIDRTVFQEFHFITEVESPSGGS